MRSLTALVLVSHLFDTATFLVCVRVFPIEAELNPLARAAYESGGDLGAIFHKAILVSLFLVGARYFNVHTWVFWFAAGMGVLGGVVNTLSLLTIGT